MLSVSCCCVGWAGVLDLDLRIGRCCHTGRMQLARSAERVIERLIDRVAGLIFPGQLQPAELTARIVRIADLATSAGIAGTEAPNHFLLRVNGSELAEGSSLQELESVIEAATEAHAADQGWRLAGPISVIVEADTEVARGKLTVTSSFVAGSREPWGRLVGAQNSFELCNNRVLIGRSGDSDVKIGDDSVSRHHALIFRENQQIWTRDSGSANGTFVGDGVVIGQTAIGVGDVIRFGSVEFRLKRSQSTREQTR